MKKEKLKGIIESLLFAWGEDLSLSDISKILEIPSNKVKKILNEMISEYEIKPERGIYISYYDNLYRIGTKPIYYNWVKKLEKPINQKKLSNAALETLAIVAYKQPVTKAEIEEIRGVKSDTAIYNLLASKLITEKGRLDKIGRPILYGTDINFLNYFGLNNLNELPRIDCDKIENGDDI